MQSWNMNKQFVNEQRKYESAFGIASLRAMFVVQEKCREK